MFQHGEFCMKKSPKRMKGINILPSPEVKGERRPFSTGDLRDKKMWRIKDDVFDRRPRAATYHGSQSSFRDNTSMTTCYNCLFDTDHGRQFCEIMGSKYCYQCIRASKKNDLDEEVSCAMGISQNINKTSFSDTVHHIRHSPSMALPNDRKWFTRLHNLNSISEYYINPMDGIGTNLASSRQNLACGSSSLVTLEEECDSKTQLVNQGKTTQNHSLHHVPGHDEDIMAQKLEKSLSRKKRKLGTGGSKRKFVTFNGLPIEPPLITVDLSNQIMNNTAVNDFELTLYRS